MFDTLAWIVPRQSALKYLRLDELQQERGQPDAGQAGEEDFFQLSSAQLDLLGHLCGSGPEDVQAARFWATCGLVQLLAAWGHRFASALHGCPCHSRRRKGSANDGERRRDACPMEGRMTVPLAAGLADEALNRLAQIKIPPRVSQAVLRLQEVSQDEAASLMTAFKDASARLTFRVKQVFGYWKSLPWSLFMVMRPWVERFSDEQERAECIDQCKQAALCLIASHDETYNKAGLGDAWLRIQNSPQS